MFRLGVGVGVGSGKGLGLGSTPCTFGSLKRLTLTMSLKMRPEAGISPMILSGIPSALSASAAGAASSALPASGETCVLVRARVGVWASACSPSQRRHPRCTGQRGLGMRTVRHAQRWHRNEALRLGTQGAQEAVAVRVRCAAGPYRAHTVSMGRGPGCSHCQRTAQHVASRELLPLSSAGVRPRAQPRPGGVG